MNNLQSKATHGVVWSAIERYSLQGVQFILTLVMARLLTPHDYGLIGMLAIFMGVSQVFIDGGFSNALIRSKKRTEEDYCTVFYINLVISIIIYCILFVSAPLIEDYFHQPLLKEITRIYSLNLILNSLVAVNKVQLTVNVDFKTLSKISLTAALISGIIGIIFAYLGIGVWALVVQMLLNAVFNVVLSIYYVRWFPREKFSMESFHCLFGYGSKLLLASLLHSVYVNLYNLVIGKRYSSADLGLYTRAQQFAYFAGSNVSDVLQRVSFPILSELQDDDNRLISAYRKYIGLATWALFPVLLGLCGMAKPLITAILTEKWLECVPYMQILCFSLLCDSMNRVNLNLLYVKGRSDWVLRLEIVKKVIAMILLFTAMFYGIKAICFSKVLYSIISLYLNTYYTNKLFNYGFIQQIKEVLPQLFLAIIMMFGCLVFSYSIFNPFISLFASLTTGVLFYILGSHVMKLYPYYAFKDMIKKYL